MHPPQIKITDHKHKSTIVSDIAQIWLNFITICTFLYKQNIYNLPGNGNSILRSIRPGRMSAGSKDSILFVAITTLTSPLKMSA